MKRHAIVLLTALLVGATGCNRTPAPANPGKPAPPSSTNVRPAPPTAPPESAPVEEAEAKPASAMEKPTAVASAEVKPDAIPQPAADPQPLTDAAKEVATADDTAESAEPAAAPLSTGLTKRLLLYTPSGPIVAEFVLRIDGRGAIDINDAFVDELLKAADTDQDGATKWSEALSNERSGIPQFIGQSGGNAQEFYDRDRDGVVDRNELWNLLGHGEAGLAFRLEHADGPGGATTAHEVARLLDTDGDGVLSLAEIDQAPSQLRLADVNDDERLTPDDLGAPTMGMPRAEMSGSLGNVVTSASILDEETDWGVIHYELDQRYLMHGQFRGGQLPLFPELAKKLDADENGVLSLAEAEILNYLTPQLRFEVEFGAADAAGGRLKIVDLRDDLSSGVQQRLADRFAQFDWPNLTLAFSVADNANPGDVAALVDARFAELDQDKNGYLEVSETGKDQSIAFQRWDGNADGKVYPEELTAALQAERMPLLNRVRAVITPGEHSLWAAIDADRNGILSAREIQESAARLRAADRDGGGRLTKDEIPTRIAMHFERGMSGGPAQPVSYGAPAPDAPREAPVWFQRMDSNSDGDISPREFLGSPETFTRLDRDSDALLSLAEATADTPNVEVKQE